MINTLGTKQRFVKQFEKWRFVRICVVKISHRMGGMERKMKNIIINRMEQKIENSNVFTQKHTLKRHEDCGVEKCVLLCVIESLSVAWFPRQICLPQPILSVSLCKLCGAQQPTWIKERKKQKLYALVKWSSFILSE